MRLRLLLTASFVVLSIVLMLGQSLDQERLSVEFDNVSLSEALIQLDELTEWDLAYDPRILPNSNRVNVTFDDYTIRDILDYLIAQTNAEYTVSDGQIIIRKKDAVQEYTLSGYVMDDITKEKLAYATLYFSEIEQGITANEQGYYSMKLPTGTHTVHIGYVGRDESALMLNVTTDESRNFELSQIQSLQEVVVTPDALLGSTSLHRSYQRQDIQTLALNTPAVGGESDVLQIVRNLAGVESNAGGVGSMFVRGGEDDHNLVLMDGVPIYYPAHLLGIYSIFNSESVRNVEVYKGGFPARYGGRLASVIDIQTKDGRTDGWHSDISTSYESLRGALQGPISPRINIMLAGRQSLYAPYMNDVIAESFYRIDGSDLDSDYSDFHAKLSAKVGQKGKLIFSAYKGNDIVDINHVEGDVHQGSSSRLNWVNRALTAAYHQEIGQNSFLKISRTANKFLSQYGELINYKDAEQIATIGNYEYFGTNSDNKDVETKMSVDHFINPRLINRYGISNTSHTFIAATNNLSERDNGEVENSSLNLGFFQRIGETLKASSSAIYFEQERKFSPKLFANMGLRWSSFQSDTSSYQHLEPRLNFKYMPTDALTISLSASKMVQYVHQISDANLSFPKDVWLPANEIFLPSVSWQFGGGFNRRFENKASIDVQAYYTEMQNLNYVFDIYNLTNIAEAYREIENFTGSGKNMGVEITAEIPFKKLHWVNALTISKSRRAFELINNDQEYPFQFDRRIVLKSSITYSASKALTIGSRVYIGSAAPEYFIDLSNSASFTFINLVPSNSENSERANTHFRLDLSATLKLGGNKVQHQLKANIYNAFNTKNSGFTYRDGSQPESSRNDVFALPFIPSLQYNLSF